LMVIKGDEIYNLEDLPIEEQLAARESLREFIEYTEGRKSYENKSKIKRIAKQSSRITS